MKILLINASPKPKHSTSLYLLNYIQEQLPSNTCQILTINNKTNVEEVAKIVLRMDSIVFAFPLYVDGIPSHFLEFLTILETILKKQNSTSNIVVYGIVNCGFYEGHQTRLAIDMLHHFTNAVNLTWGYGLGIGAGELISHIESVPMGKSLKKNLGQQLSTLIMAIEKKETKQDICITMNFPRFLYRLAADHSWIIKAKKMNLTKKDLYIQR